MVNEATLYFETANPIPLTCSNSVGIAKGALLTLSDPMTAAAVTVSKVATAGIAREEKIADDGKTKLSVYREGVFRVTASGALTVGQAGMFTNSNHVVAANLNDEHVAGAALETAADGETFLFELKPMHYKLA